MERGEELVIQVLDNGAGMEKAQREMLLAGKERQDNHASGIGTGNVFRRLRLMFPGCRIRISGPERAGNLCGNPDKCKGVQDT